VPNRAIDGREIAYSPEKKVQYHSGSQKCSLSFVRNRFVCTLLLVALAGLSQRTSAAAAGSGAKPSASQVQQKSPGDAQIERTLRAKLAKSKINADHFTFTVSKGVVTIEGNTGVMQHKGAMTRMARTSGATLVRNNIRISDAARAKATAALAKHRPGSAASTVGDSAPVAPAPIPHAVVVSSASPK
jgi:hypothetical protein